MPNTRRRRFSVQKDVGGRDSTKMQSSFHGSYQDTENSKALTKSSSKSGNKIMSTNNAEVSGGVKILTESVSSILTIKCKTTTDENVTTSSSNIDLFHTPNETETPTDQSFDTVDSKESSPKIRDSRLSRDKVQVKNKHPRQHRIKVRSPKRRLPAFDQKNFNLHQRSVEIDPIDWEQEVEVVNNTTNLAVTTEANRVSNQSLDDMCRICHGGPSLSNLGQLISACSCRGTVGRVHVNCLERWLTESGKSRCELCGTRYVTKRVHRYGVTKALLMWIVSQNAKQLMVDTLGIILMSPLAVLAAWLSGRTLAGLMKQDNTATPWPLASTFVLACMTLVCYYCWIVSAATRHALGWWIWYRSQYEIRLQLQETED